MIKIFFRWLLAFLMVSAGVTHFLTPDVFLKIMPAYLPWPLALVYISGVFEVAGGIGLLLTRLRKSAAWGLVALYIAVFPANLNMALNQIPFGDTPTPLIFLWLRLPVQFILIYWAWTYTRTEKTKTI